jgi:hypothetical protein
MRSQNYERCLLVLSYLSICPPVRMEQFGSQIFMKFNLGVLFENLSRKVKLHYNRT